MKEPLRAEEATDRNATEGSGSDWPHSSPGGAFSAWWVGAFWLTVLGLELAGACWLLSRWRG